MTMHVEYDAEARCLYVTLGEGEVAETRELSEWRVADYDASGQLVGIEFIAIDVHPIDLEGLEQSDAIRAAISLAHDATVLPA